AVGPLIGKSYDFWNLTAGNVIQLASGEKTHFGRELVRFSRGVVPGGNLWYLKLAYERGLVDQLQWLADPEAKDAFKRQRQNWMRDYGQGFWWEPGSSPLPLRAPEAPFGPQRAPDLGAALGN
ncbi:MAG: hypothetical protein KF723_23185, partial [Rhizobiaceae bacterium]|nr:hypothetical protein [Rhizobiaceae bacterium]